MAIKHFRRYAREWAMQFLFQYDLASVENTNESIDIFLAQLEDSDVFGSPADAKTFRKVDRTMRTIICGILENLNLIDETISKFSEKWTLSRMDTVDRNVMRVAVYEMLFCQNIPPVVSINEAVEIGKTYGTDNTAAFINGVLNAVMKTLDRPSREAVAE